MRNKLMTPLKVMRRLGLRRIKTGNYDYIDPNEKNRSKYNPVRNDEQKD